VSIFILPPTADALVNRLGGRNTESPGELRKRLLTAVGELREATSYDYVVVNYDRVQAVAEVASIIDAEARKPHRLEDLQGLLDRLSSGLAREADKLSAE
jgi:guanylate kinase